MGTIRRGVASFAVMSAAMLAAGVALAQGTGNGLPAVLAGELMTELIGLFVVATVLESALATIFNWRVYREFFNGRAVKTLVMIAFGYAIVRLFDYDVVSRIVKYAGAVDGERWLSQILSALVLAGGSAAVYELFKALGMRPPVEPVERAQPAQDKAWVSVRIVRRKAIGEVKIHFDQLPEPAEPDGRPTLAGVVGTSRTILRRLAALFFADPMRFPSYGGRTVEAGKLYRITAKWQEQPVNPDDPPVLQSETVYEGRFAGRGVVDLVQQA